MIDVLVIGGGVIGCTIALRLAKAGVRTALLERGRIGQEASWAAAGMLGPHSEAAGPDPFFELCTVSQQLYPEFAAELFEDSGIDVHYRTDGGLFVVMDEVDAAQSNRWTGWQTGNAARPRPLSSRELRDIEPAISDLAMSGVEIPGDHQVDNRLLMKALSRSMTRSGVVVHESHDAGSLLLENGRVVGAVCAGQRFSSGSVVIAAGCWSSSLLDPLGIRINVVPAHGQMLAVVGPSLRHIIHSSDCYIVPRTDGRVLIGATVEYAGFEKRVTAGSIRSLIAGAERLVPSISQAEIAETWSGLRPDTPDHLPLLGPSGIDGLLLATGHFRNGILLAPITAKLISTIFQTGQTPAELSPFTIDRLSSPGGQTSIDQR
jgi:glycine oxidase